MRIRWALVAALILAPSVASAQAMVGWMPVWIPQPPPGTVTPAPKTPAPDEAWQIVTMTPGRGNAAPNQQPPGQKMATRQQVGPAVDCNMPVIVGDARIDPKFVKPAGDPKDAMAIVAAPCPPKKK